jgi:hypothetical protein
MVEWRRRKNGQAYIKKGYNPRDPRGLGINTNDDSSYRCPKCNATGWSPRLKCRNCGYMRDSKSITEYGVFGNSVSDRIAKAKKIGYDMLARRYNWKGDKPNSPPKKIPEYRQKEVFEDYKKFMKLGKEFRLPDFEQVTKNQNMTDQQWTLWHFITMALLNKTKEKVLTLEEERKATGSGKIQTPMGEFDLDKIQSPSERGQTYELPMFDSRMVGYGLGKDEKPYSKLKRQTMEDFVKDNGKIGSATTIDEDGKERIVRWNIGNINKPHRWRTLKDGTWSFEESD